MNLNIKLVRENKGDWDEHSLTIIFSYIIAYKVFIRYIP